MKKLVIMSLAASFAAGAFAQDMTATATSIWSGSAYDKASTGLGLAEDAVYSNVTTFTGSAYSNGGAANQSGNTITTMVADDLLAAFPNAVVDAFTFSVSNLNTVAVSARPRVRFYADNGGTPGNYISGFSFNPISFAAGSVQLFNANISTSTFAIPADGKLWAAITFDNNTGGTGATATQLNNLGQGIFNPPTVGSSQDVFFQTTAAGSFLSNNPAGSLFNFSGNPVANFGWSFSSTAVPEPASMAALGFGLVGIAARRRRNRK